MAFNVAATVTLCSCRNASLFWIMLWLVSRPTDHGMILAGRSFLAGKWLPRNITLASSTCSWCSSLYHCLEYRERITPFDVGCSVRHPRLYLRPGNARAPEPLTGAMNGG
jgi:hypothetical protein